MRLCLIVLLPTIADAFRHPPSEALLGSSLSFLVCIRLAWDALSFVSQLAWNALSFGFHLAWIASSVITATTAIFVSAICGLYLIGQPCSWKCCSVCCCGKLGPCWFVLVLVVAPLSHGMPLGPQSTAEAGRAARRTAATLQATRVVRKQTLDSREKLLNEFGNWLWSERGVRLSSLLEKKPMAGTLRL